jgi:HK97 family phage major capsid protein
MDQSTREKVLNERYWRDLRLNRGAVNAETRTADLAFSSDKPYARWWGIEILSHEPGDVKLDRMMDGAALLLNHNMSEQIGVVERCSVDADRVGRALVRFSKSEDAEEVFQDVLDGIRTKTSVGYMVHSMTEIKPEEMDEALKNMCAGEGLKAYRCTWEPYEVSIVSVPADASVGVGRSKEVTPTPAKEQETITINTRGAKMDENKTPSPEEVAKLAQLDNAIRAANKAEIEALARQYMGRVPKIDELRDAAVKAGVDGAAFNGILFDALPSGEQLETPAGAIGLSGKEVRQFSVARLLAHAAGEKVDASFELECSRAVEAKIGQRNKPGSILLPWEIAGPTAQRDLSYAGGATAGANLVGTNLQANEWEPMLRAKSVAANLGVRRMTVSGGNVTFPRQTGAATAYYPGEGGAFTESNQTFGLVTAMPNEVGTFTDVSRRLLVQGTPSVEMIVREDLIQTIMLSEETQLFSGAGTSYPTGIINTSSVGTVTAAGISWAGAVEFETDIQTANADVSTMKYAFNAAGAGILKTRAKEAGHPIYLMGDDRRMNGYDVVVSNLVASGYGFFGDWSKALLVTWGAIEIIPDVVTQAANGLVRFNVFHLMDVAIKQPSAFTFCSDLS